MDPQLHPGNESAPLKLPEVKLGSNEPKSNIEAPGSRSSAENATSKAIEQGSLKQTAYQTPQPIPAAMPIDPSAFSNSVNGQPQARKIPVLTSDLQAADADLIEKAWVVKAKAIVAQTKNDPYEQTNELTKIKADYQQKRFSNNLKIDKE